MIYVVSKSSLWCAPRPVEYYRDVEAARRAVERWVSGPRAGAVVPSLSGMSAFDEVDAIRVYPIEEGSE